MGLRLEMVGGRKCAGDISVSTRVLRLGKQWCSSSSRRVAFLLGCSGNFTEVTVSSRGRSHATAFRSNRGCKLALRKVKVRVLK